jgi:hypothetical protein
MKQPVTSWLKSPFAVIDLVSEIIATVKVLNQIYAKKASGKIKCLLEAV